MSARTGFQGQPRWRNGHCENFACSPWMGARRSRDREANGRGGGRVSVSESATIVMTCLHTTPERESTEWDRPIVAQIEGKGKGKGKRVVRKANKTVYIYRSRLLYQPSPEAKHHQASTPPKQRKQKSPTHHPSRSPSHPPGNPCPRHLPRNVLVRKDHLLTPAQAPAVLGPHHHTR